MDKPVIRLGAARELAEPGAGVLRTLGGAPTHDYVTIVLMPDRTRARRGLLEEVHDGAELLHAPQPRGRGDLPVAGHRLEPVDVLGTSGLEPGPGLVHWLPRRG